MSFLKISAIDTVFSSSSSRTSGESSERGMLRHALAALPLLMLAGACGSTNAPDGQINGGLGRTIIGPDGKMVQIDIDGDGKFDGVGVDTTGDGIVDALAIDRDNDGIIDAIDRDGDMIPDVATNLDGTTTVNGGLGTTIRDENGNLVQIDIDKDGILDGIGMDTNGDGVVDALGLDRNNDGIIDAIDRDGDRIPEVAVDISGGSGTDNPGTGGGGNVGGGTGGAASSGTGGTTEPGGTGGSDPGGTGGGSTTEPHPDEKCLGGYLIDDFSDASTYPLFRPYNDGKASNMSPAPNTTIAPVMGALRLTGSGYIGWGAGVGRQFDAPVECEARSIGVKFRAKASAPGAKITVASPVSATTLQSEGGTCKSGVDCNNHHQRVDLALSTEWKTYEVRWTEMKQLLNDQGGLQWGFYATLDVRSIVEILFTARPNYQPFDYWIDDLQLMDNGSDVGTVSDGLGGDTAAGGTGGGCVLDSVMGGEAAFNAWFDARRNKSFYTYASLCTALELFPGFASSGNAETNKREVAAFFANVARETGELEYIEEIIPSVPNYYGRGPLQLTHSYNYQSAGGFLGVDLLANPGLLATDAVLSWRAALWFWMKSDGAGKGTCHGAMVQGSGFGQTINVINGGLECPSSGNTAAGQRIGYYTNYCGKLGVSPGGNTGC